MGACSQGLRHAEVPMPALNAKQPRLADDVVRHSSFQSLSRASARVTQVAAVVCSCRSKAGLSKASPGGSVKCRSTRSRLMS